MPDKKRDDTTGLYAEKAPLDAVIDVFDRVRGPVITTSDVAEHLDCTPRQHVGNSVHYTNGEMSTSGRRAGQQSGGIPGETEPLPTSAHPHGMQSPPAKLPRGGIKTGENTDTAVDATRDRDTTLRPCSAKGQTI
jgi:hypothetical protein